MEALRASSEERFKTAFKRIEDLEKKIGEHQKEIENLKTDMLGVTGVLRKEISSAMSSLNKEINDLMTGWTEKENERLRVDNERLQKQIIEAREKEEAIKLERRKYYGRLIIGSVISILVAGSIKVFIDLIKAS